jgi:type VI secretion system secreted protein VgrG
MAISTKISIHIDGEELTRFTQLVIDQKVHTHHRFSLLQPIPKEFVDQAIDKTQSYMGKPISITIEPNNMTTESPLLFNGIITEAQMVRTAGASGGIIINGYSPTIAMEGVPSTKSFNDKTLSDIVNEITGKYAQKEVKPTVDIQKDTSMSYTVQYGESDFAFLCRIAQKKGQWYYYNGEESFFGKPQSKTFTLEYGRSLHSFNIEMRVKSLSFEYMGYDPSNAETKTASSAEVNYQPKGYEKAAFDASKKLFPDTSTLLYSNALEEGNSHTHLLDRVTTQLQSRSADLITAKGESDETGIRIGDVVQILEPNFSMTGNAIDGLKEQNFGSYLITDIMHVCDEAGSYHNTFNAVPESVLSPPYGNVHSNPIAQTQPAIVMDNHDPKGLSRIQVQFPWQKTNNTKTPWIRVTTPYAGKGKGFHVLPEIGEEVMVDFEGGNAEKPVVIGTMFHGEGKSGHGGAGNYIKGFTTASGNKVEMNDEKKTVTISDPSGNTVTMNGDGTMTISAPNKIDIKSKEINIEATEKVTMSGTNTVTIDSKEIAVTGTTSVKTSSDTLIEDTAPKIGLKGDAQVEIAAVTVNVNGTAMTNVKGGMVNLN